MLQTKRREMNREINKILKQMTSAILINIFSYLVSMLDASIK